MGLPLVLHWGPHIPDPIYLLPSWPSHSPLSRLMMFLLLSSNLVSYALDSAPLVRYCQRTFHPTFDVHDWSFKAVLRYALLSLPTFLFGLLAALTVGNLLSLLGHTPHTYIAMRGRGGNVQKSMKKREASTPRWLICAPSPNALILPFF